MIWNSPWWMSFSLFLCWQNMVTLGLNVHGVYFKSSVFHISWWCSRSSWHLGKTYKRQWGKMIQTVHFKLYCFVKMHKMSKLLKNCGGRVLQDNLMKSGPLKISFRDSFMGVSLHYQLRKRWDGDRNALWLQFKTPQPKVCVCLRYV